MHGKDKGNVDASFFVELSDELPEAVVLPTTSVPDGPSHLFHFNMILVLNFNVMHFTLAKNKTKWAKKEVHIQLKVRRAQLR